MKKVIAIIVFGLLWCNLSFAKIVFSCPAFVSHIPNSSTYTIDLERGIIKQESLDVTNIWRVDNNFGDIIVTTGWISSSDTASEQFKLMMTWLNWQITFDLSKKKITSSMVILPAMPKNVRKNLEKTLKNSTEAVYCNVENTYTKKPKQSPDDDKIVAAASGTGFFVSRSGHIVTNHHVIDECKAVKVNFKGREIDAKILAIDKTNDLAIIQAKINPSKVYPVSNKDVSLLQDIIVAGFPLGKNVSSAIKTHKGSVTALAGFGDNYSNFQTDATINQGNSGGPVIDYKGNIVGVAVALMSAEAGQNIFFAVKSSTLKTFANANGITFLTPNSREMPNEELGQLITEGTVFLECWMTVAKIKQMIAEEENRKAFYSEYK